MWHGTLCKTAISALHHSHGEDGTWSGWGQGAYIEQCRSPILFKVLFVCFYLYLSQALRKYPGLSGGRCWYCFYCCCCRSSDCVTVLGSLTVVKAQTLLRCCKSFFCRCMFPFIINHHRWPYHTSVRFIFIIFSDIERKQSQITTEETCCRTDLGAVEWRSWSVDV